MVMLLDDLGGHDGGRKLTEESEREKDNET